MSVFGKMLFITLKGNWKLKKKKPNVASFNNKYSKDQCFGVFFHAAVAKGFRFVIQSLRSSALHNHRETLAFFSVALSGGGHVGK